MDHDTQLAGLSVTAAKCGVPCRWLRAEAEAGRLPHLRAGNRMLFNVEAVRALLLSRAAGEGKAVTCAS